MSTHHRKHWDCCQNQPGIPNRQQHPPNKGLIGDKPHVACFSLFVCLYFPVALASKSNWAENRRQTKTVVPKQTKNNKGIFEEQEVKKWALRWNLAFFCPACLCFLSPWYCVIAKYTPWSLNGNNVFLFLRWKGETLGLFLVIWISACVLCRTSR